MSTRISRRILATRAQLEDGAACIVATDLAEGVVAVTASPEVRYLAPIRLEDSLEVIARVEEHEALPLYYVRSEHQQCGALVAKGKAKFFVKPTKT